MRTPPVETRYLNATDGTRIFLTELGDPGASRTLVIVHGYAEHGGRYLKRAQLFAEAGYRVLIPDMRGHGRSDGPRGYVAAFHEYVDDLRMVLRHVHTPPAQTALFGHSNGGLICARYLTTGADAVRVAALTSPLLGLSIQPPAWKLGAAKLLSRFVPRVSLPSEIDPAILSHDPEAVADHRTDPLIHHVDNARWFAEAQRTWAVVYADAAHVSVPLLVLQAGDDRLVSPAAARAFATRAPHAAYEEIAGAFHELWFEKDGETHARRVLTFFNAQLDLGAR